MSRLAAILPFIAIVFFAASCKKDVSALKLSNDLAKINDSLARYGKEWGDEFKRAYNTADFSGLYPIRARMEVFVNRKIDCVSNMKDVGGSREFREKELEYLRFEKGLISNKFARFEYFNDLTPPGEMEKAFEELMSASAQEQFILEQLHKEVQKYADKNGLGAYPSD